MLMNMISTPPDISGIYEITTIILGTASLTMGLTLLILGRSEMYRRSRANSAFSFLVIALFALSIINLLEYIFGVDSQRASHSLAIVVFAASLEMFLLFTAYMSILRSGFATKRRIAFELTCIALFTTPAMLVNPESYPLLYDILFAVGLLFYSIKLVCNFVDYKRQMRRIKANFKNLLSDDSRIWLTWINNTFYVVVMIGVVSVVIPMTNFMVLVPYNVFLVVAYIYIYISVLKNRDAVSLLEDSKPTCDDVEQANGEVIDEHVIKEERRAKSADDFMYSRQRLFDEWIANRGYAVAGVTSTEIAAHLKTNRNRLSQYLKNELNLTYYQWIAGLRIEDAKKQLIEFPDRTVYEIALNVGIEDRDNFRRAFQHHTGVSPTTYRKEYVDKK